MLVRSRRTTVLNRVTAVCIEAIPAFSTTTSHVPGSCARATTKKRKGKGRRRSQHRKVVAVELEGAAAMGEGSEKNGKLSLLLLYEPWLLKKGFVGCCKVHGRVKTIKSKLETVKI
ncbi:hypothetical protein PanWU01x14_156500 [Parasponia andersonii]|uniref:Uncharacterized protein n=1 Tax=Parasponia andersonii TaxID=3476 RepID=A0A2P5CFV0_PARAD|nr:hypothetical protein PanWU01x14_156500 [Parasponia andersonii]